jgi:Icc-related predicted phosphoesterase
MNEYVIAQKPFFAFSDTHGRHRDVTMPNGVDTLVFAGDACELGDLRELWRFFEWFSDLPVPNKLFVPGNHDFLHSTDMAKALIPDNVTYIEQGEVTLSGIRFYVLPARPYLATPVQLPLGIDVLVTHGPPEGILDDDRGGCPILRAAVNAAAPEVHIFGHVHATGLQSVTEGATTFYNVARFNSLFETN